ncbi:cell division protein ZapA [Marinicrinis lubricantis]|uniref:Cell division protein ZapA n=1 Tax=Marinicrinis lubricantis TaxID=2086470 RepID=A0ABW1ILL3_9BACL
MNSEAKTRVTVDIYGTNYTIMGGSDTSVEHIKQVAKLLDEQMKQIARANPKLDMPRIAVLSAVNVMDDAIRAKEALKQMQQKQEINREIQSEEINQLREANARLKQEHSEINQQLERERQQVQSVREQLSHLQKEVDQLKEEKRQTELQVKQQEQKNDSFESEYHKLKEEYGKLQTEFNEWLRLMEQDPESKK